MDVSAGYDLPNPYGLGASEFDYDMPSYKAALAFLSDLAGGTSETRALEINGGNPAMLVMWQRSARFRRVLAKCRAGAAQVRLEQETATADHAVEGMLPAPGEQAFVRFEDMPFREPSVFAGRANPASFGAA